MQQYRDIKARHPQTILFFRMGDFYDMFEDDAKLAARELGLTLTSRNNGGAAEVPLAGVPVKAATEYLRRLIANGHRVAICEQVQHPKLAKGVVRRAVVETVTPGTVLTDDWLLRNRNNYLVAVDPRGMAVGVAALDLTTGELMLEIVAPDDIDPVLARYEARELVVPAGMTTSWSALTVTQREEWEFDPELAREDLLRTYGLASLDGLGIGVDDRPALGGAGRRAVGRPRRTCPCDAARAGRAAGFDSALARRRGRDGRPRAPRHLRVTRRRRAPPRSPRGHRYRVEPRPRGTAARATRRR